MNARPRRRTLTPNPLGLTDRDLDASAPAAAPGPAAEAAPAAEPAPREGAGASTRTTFQHPIADGRRARAAWKHTELITHIPSYSAFVNAAVLEKVAALEAEHNGGEPFGSIDALPPGRKL